MRTPLLTIGALRYDNTCDAFGEVADLAQVCKERYDKVMARIRKLK